MVRVAVTGGAGFIGSHIAVHLARLGYRVVAVDSLERATGFERLEEAGVPLVRADLRHDDLPDADVVVHAAAYIDVAESWERPYEYMWNNAAVTAKVAKRAAERGAHLIYISSAAVYGEPEYLPIDERHPTKPKSPYGLSKLVGEQIAEMLTKKLTVARLFNVYGPGQSGPYSGVITKFIQRAKQGKPPVIFGDGEQTRDFIHVEDVARFVAVTVEKGATGVYNVGTGIAVSIRKLADIVMKIFKIEGTVRYAPPRPGDIKHSVAEISRAFSLGWKPQIALEDGLRKLIDI
ncbi:NAD-dependent epimerase/dehydratase family protein [Pyrobaculum sp.]|uniref:NAD-dependent epimerase/dehydratase family protein n=1 Tax=Pyrobaculum sp. TaxID=2004705 RepID=UPI003D0C342C